MIEQAQEVSSESLPQPSELEVKLSSYFASVDNWLDFANKQPENAQLVYGWTLSEMQKYTPILDLMNEEEFLLAARKAIVEGFNKSQTALDTVLGMMPNREDGANTPWAVRPPSIYCGGGEDQQP